MRYDHFSMLPDKAFKPTGFGSSARMTLEGGGGSPFSPEFIQNLLHPGQSQQAADDWVKMMQGGQQQAQPHQPYQSAYQPYQPPTTQPQPWWMQQGAGATANAMQQQPQTQSTQIPSWANQQGAGATANAYQNYMQQLQQPQAGLGALVPQPPYK
jgi:hypothetical protein